MTLHFQGKRLKEPVVAGQESRMEAERIHSSNKRSRSERDVPEGSSKGVGGLLPWQNASSRIVRVSRVSGGKDRHSKVLTVKGLRDRRVRLSVSTSIQFYDLQDRLGYDQPSKAVDWLIKAAAAAIVNLPELEGPFPGPPSTAIPSRDILLKRSTVGEHDISQSKSTCSSASETSKSSVMSLSKCRSVIKENEYFRNHNKESSLCEFLAPGDNCTGGDAADGFVTLGTGFDHKQLKPLPASSTSDFFRQTGMFPQLEPSFYSLLHYGSNPNVGTGGMAYSATAPGEHQDIHQLSFMQDHAIPVTMLATRGDPNPNVSISSGIAGFTRGTLQSNSPNQHQLVPGANLPFFRSATIPITTAAGSSLENQFLGDFNGRLQLFCNDVERHPELKRERKG